jgi:GDP-mannose 6-dehydrogenase
MTTALSVFGLGYVGCVSAACFAREGHRVIGVDVNPDKVGMINRGQSTIVEAGIGDLVDLTVADGTLQATTDPQVAVRDSTVSLVCVGTPSRPNGAIDLSYIERVCRDIGNGLREKSDRHTVVIRSTVLPGTLHGTVIPTLEHASGKRVGADIGICNNPEFLREGTSIKDFFEPPYTLIGADDDASATTLAALYAGIDAPLHVTSIGVAEVVKYACNCFHALKIGFANEIGNLCKDLEIDSHEVMRLFTEDRKLNISTAYLKPGFAFGGSCLPKDIRAVLHQAKGLDLDLPILTATLESNQRQIHRAFDMITATGQKRIGVLGLSFKEGTDDLRESPMVALIERLIGKGFDLAIYDSDVSQAQVVGANREYIEREIPHIWSLVQPSVAEVMESSETVVIGNSATEFSEISRHLRKDHVVVDLVRAFGDRTSGDGYHGICW